MYDANEESVEEAGEEYEEQELRVAERLEYWRKVFEDAQNEKNS